MRYKQILLLLAITLSVGVFTAQKRNIKSPSAMTNTELWKKTDSLAQKSLPLQAQPLLDELKSRAYQEKNSAEAVKVLMYSFKLNERRTEDALKTYIGNLEKETKTAWEPYKQIAHSMLGEMYQMYYSSNRYRLMDTAGNEDENSGEWSHQYVITKIRYHYRASTSNTKLLQSTGIESIKPILTESKLSNIIRPTLYDFLSNRAIDALQNSEYNVLKPENQYIPDDENLWKSAAEFIKLNIEATDDVLNPQLEALKTYQELLKFRLSDIKNSAALIDADLNRLKTLQRFFVGENKDSLYWDALSRLSKSTTDDDMVARLLVEKASFLTNLNQEAITGIGKNHPTAKALKLLDECIKKHPNSESACIAHNMRNAILEKELTAESETAVSPNKPIPFKINYRNTTTAYLHIVKVNKEQFEKYSNRNDKLTNFLVEQKPIRSTKITLPDFFDYQIHSAHYEDKPLETGHYFIIFSLTPEIKLTNNILSINKLQTTTLSSQDIREKQNLLKVKVTDRITGETIENAEVTLTYTIKRSDKKLILNTDSEGEALFEVDKETRNYCYTVKKGNDLLIINNQWGYYYDNTPKYGTKTLFFTDRKIYRPGQTVHFKAITIKGIKENWETVENQPTTVILRDKNGKEQGKLNLRTNEYGSVWGSFVIPQGSINGNWYLSNDNGSVNISVEEYKRPRFEVDFKSFTDIIIIGDTAIVKGEARAYAGNKVAGAKVSYTVKYNEQTYWRLWRTKEHLITHGETTTDDKGNFEIPFVASPVGKKQNLYKNPVFEVHAIVTDLTGETHELSTSISANNSGVSFNISGIENYINTQPVKFEYEALNSNGQPVKWNSKIRVISQKRTEKFTSELYWTKPDTIITLTDNFGLNNNQNWTDDRVVLERDVTTSESKFININEPGKLEAGYYRIEMSGLDKNNKPIKQEQYFTVIEGVSTETHHTAKPAFVKITEASDKEVSFIAASAINNAKGLLTISFDNGNIQYKTVDLNGSQKRITIPVVNPKCEKVRVSLMIISNNRSYSASDDFVVEHPERTLTPALKTWRNKTLPGSSEEWIMEITRNGKPASNSEIVATLYDSSLDMFAANNWYFSAFGIWFNPASWNIQSLGTQYPSTHNNLNIDYKECKTTNYPTLNWFGYYINSDGPIMYSMGAGMRKAVRIRGSSTVASMALLEVVDEESNEIITTGNGTSTPDAPVQPDFIRSDFSETAFFYPDLKTDEKGESKIKFTLPDNVTTYKFMALVHTGDGAWGKITEKLTVQKELMVQPNMPAFLREGDIITITANMVSLSDETMDGSCSIEISDIYTNQPLKIVDGSTTESLTLRPKSSEAKSWTIKVPEGKDAIKVTISATAGNHTDGEEYIIPILPRKVAVYESESFVLYEEGTHKVTFPGFKLRKGEQKLEFGYTTATATEALKALPLLMDANYDASDLVFNRFFGYAVGARLAREAEITSLLQSWKANAANDLESPLLKDDHLKSITINETPWLSAANNESAARRRLVGLLDKSATANTMNHQLAKLADMQNADGSFPWFAGMYPSRYMTQHITAAFGWLFSIDGDLKNQETTKMIVSKSCEYLQKELSEDLANWKKNQPGMKITGYNTIQLLYALSFHKELKEIKDAAPFIENIRKEWTSYSVHGQAVIALILERYGYHKDAVQIVESLKENLVRPGSHLAYNKEQGLFWYSSIHETQVVILNAIAEVTPGDGDIKAIRNWLITQKRTQAWRTSRTTSMAVYAILSTSEIVKTDADVVKIGKQSEKTTIEKPYVSFSWSDKEVTKSAGEATIVKKGDGPSFGSWNFLYFEDNDKVEAHSGSELSIKRDMYLVTNTAAGDKLTSVDATTLRPGDRIRVRLTITAQNRMEFIHINDQRSAGTELVEQTSGYRYSRRLGYYQSMHDASADFFMDVMPKGTYTIEYDLYVVRAGSMSHGFAMIENFYAPEMKAHTEGVSLKVVK